VFPLLLLQLHSTAVFRGFLLSDERRQAPDYRTG
jgi:hypothetical protein